MARGSGRNREKVGSASPPTMPDPAAPSKDIEAQTASSRASRASSRCLYLMRQDQIDMKTASQHPEIECVGK